MTTPRDNEFDAIGLYEALEAQRRARGISWRLMMEEINGASPEVVERHPMSLSTVKNIAKRGAVTCQHALALLRWLERSPESFVADGNNVRAAPLPESGPDTRPRWDIHALGNALDAERRKRGLTWVQLAKDIGCAPNQISTLTKRRYGIGMQLAMRITRWLERPAADFIVAATW